MPALQGEARLDVIAGKWHNLAERRLAYFTELYRSGRWRHYYTQERFALRMLDVIRAAKLWAELAGNGARPERRMERDDELRPAA
jgi:hypothetical protein